MATPVIMPRQGQSVESCLIAKWYKKKGDPVQAGELLFAYETDKAAFEEEAKVSGTILDIFFGAGDDVPVLTNVAVIGEPGEDISGLGPSLPDQAPSVSAKPPMEATTPEKPASAPFRSAEEAIKISPRARRLAEKTGVDYRAATPGGPNGRIIAQDIISLRVDGPHLTRAAWDGVDEHGIPMIHGSGIGGRITSGDLAAGALSLSANVTSSLYEELKLSNIRKVIAKAMHQSLSNTAQVTLHTSFDAGAIISLRQQWKAAAGSDLAKITITDLLLYAVARTLPGHRLLNAHFLEERILLFRHVCLGVAVDTERGLMVPVLEQADLLSLFEISAMLKKMSQECQKGTINPDLLKGGTFTVTNLGGLGIESFTPILNPPQTGILGVNNIIQRPRERDGKIELYPAMGLSLTFDHRAVDGAPAARFLQDLGHNLENIAQIL